MMEKSVDRSGSSKLKQRFARMLLGSSCSTAGVAAKSLTPQLPETEVDAGWNQRCKLDQQYWSFPANGRRCRRRIAPVVQVSKNCGGLRSVEASEPLLPLIGTEEEEERKWKPDGGMKQRSKVDLDPRMKRRSFPCLSSSDYELDLFGSDDEEESRTTLFSSKSFSSDSSEFYRHTNSKNKNKNKNTQSMKSTQLPPRRHATRSTWKGLRPLVSVSPAKGNYPAGFAVVKQSTDPYGDFRSSMVEMIVEREMNRARDLERLLHSYLKLNSDRHHRAILQAFEDICEAMFGK
ncbi:hypothetical protein ZIOFF_007217 [Zingiber officinale]|uniref:Transcription repressor n=2 Tax=Zingiber officinale TaxID=94328 RepID=A0A8J5LPV9_ZINOF|nr:hypothetical protein ZIOFF_007217 [Zingiber officinale]